MRPGIRAFMPLFASLVIYGLFKKLLNEEIATVALATLPGAISVWLERDQSLAGRSSTGPQHVRSELEDWQVAALYPVSCIVVWSSALLSIEAYNRGISDLIKSGGLHGSAQAFANLQIYYAGLDLLFQWLPLLCVFGLYAGPRSVSCSYWPYLVGSLITLLCFVFVRLLLVPGSFDQTVSVVQHVVALDLGAVEGGRYLALAATLSMGLLLISMFSVCPWLVAMGRRKFIESVELK